MKRIVLTGGGTAGHVTPNLALLPALRKQGYEIHYIGRAEGIEKDLILKEKDVIYHGIPSGKLRRYFDLKNITDVFKILAGMVKSVFLVHKIKPDIVFSKGGFVSVPVVFGGWINRVPILVHESDMTPGLANKLSKPFAKKLLCTFPEAAALAGKKGVHVGTPIRRELLYGSREKALQYFGLKDTRPVLLVMGGSTGAQSINQCVRDSLGELLKTFNIVHLTGKGNLDASYQGAEGYYQCEYLLDEMGDAYALADLILSRAGSNSICEIRALNKPALLIPYPGEVSRGDQVLNASSFEKRGLANVLQQKDMTPQVLIDKLYETYKDRGRLMDAMVKEQSKDSINIVIDLINEHAKK